MYKRERGKWQKDGEYYLKISRRWNLGAKIEFWLVGSGAGGGENLWQIQARVDPPPSSAYCESNNCFTVVFGRVRKRARRFTSDDILGNLIDYKNVPSTMVCAAPPHSTPVPPAWHFGARKIPLSVTRELFSFFFEATTSSGWDAKCLKLFLIKN